MRKVLVLLVALALAPSAAMAGPILGYAWHVGGGSSSPAAFGGSPYTSLPTSATLGTANVTFTVDGFNFYNSGDAGSATLRQFLVSGGATSIVGAPGILDVDISQSSSPTAWATYFKFTGSAYMEHNKTYDFNHDDGFYLTVGATNIDFRTPTSPQVDSFTWAGSSGVYDFTMYYGEWNGNPAALQSPDFAVPEPTSILLFGVGLVGVAGAARRRMKK